MKPGMALQISSFISIFLVAATAAFTEPPPPRQQSPIVAAPGTSGTATASAGDGIHQGQILGAVNIGASNTTAVTVTILSSGTVGSISVLTQGDANLDFTDAGGGTCAAGVPYAAYATCVVNVAFSPRFSGTRYGAVVLSDNSGNVLATNYLQGTGSGPQVNFLPGAESPMGSGGWTTAPCCLAADSAGNVYIAANGQIYKETPSAGGYTQLALSINNRSGSFAIDGAGNFYISDDGDSIYKETPTEGGYVESTLGSGLSRQNTPVVDGAGNVYIADAFNGRVLKETLSASGYTQTDIFDCGGIGVQSCPSSVAVDASGNLFVSAYDNGQILELTPSAGGYIQSNAIGIGFVWASEVVVDGNGNLFIADTLNNRIVEETLSGGNYTQSTVPTGSPLDWPWGVAVDQNDNVYIADTYNNRMLKEDFSDPPALTFANTVFGSTSSDSPQVVTVLNDGDTALNFSALSYAADFPEASPVNGDCTAGISLAAQATCTLSIDFTPAEKLSGAVTSQVLGENVILTTNALNTPGTEQAISVTGTELAPQAATPVFSPLASTYTSAQSVTITDATTGDSIYYTIDGSTPTTSSTLYSGAITVSATETIQAIAAAAGYSDSAVALATYTIDLPPTFLLTLSATSLTISPGQSGATTASIGPQNGFSAAVTFSCSGLTAGVTCTFSPSTVTPSGGAAAESTLTISSTSSASAAQPNSRVPDSGYVQSAMLAFAIWFLGYRKRRLPGLFYMIVAAAIFGVGLLTGCGGSSTPPPATSTITVIATSGALQQTTPLSVTIQ